MVDGEINQTQEQVSSANLVPPSGEVTQQVATPPVEPLTEERVAQLIAQAVDQARELGRRELQSQQDRNRAELGKAQRRAQIAEGMLGSARTQIQNIDPEIAKEIELAELRAKEQNRSMMEQEELTAKQQAEFHQSFIDRQTRFLQNLGIDPKDKRIDWATESGDYLEKMERLQSSAATIQKDTIQMSNKAFEDRLKVLELKIKAEETEANSVETSTSSGVVAMSEADFLKKFASGDLPTSKANIDRYNKYLNS